MIIPLPISMLPTRLIIFGLAHTARGAESCGSGLSPPAELLQPSTLSPAPALDPCSRARPDSDQVSEPAPITEVLSFKMGRDQQNVTVLQEQTLPKIALPNVDDFPFCAHLVSNERSNFPQKPWKLPVYLQQIRHQDLWKGFFHLRVRVTLSTSTYQQDVIVAGADRLQTVCVVPGENPTVPSPESTSVKSCSVFDARDNNKAVVMEALRRAQYKFPGQQKIIVSKKFHKAAGPVLTNLSRGAPSLVVEPTEA
ncbi:hypothetical protein KEM48_011385 [Puccinia striiformis f. sp. tritici PST-130]|nr:hypothetical protein KEM48_011385 [Puccinia striiformis f. sp. tritici PST-130]